MTDNECTIAQAYARMCVAVDMIGQAFIPPIPGLTTDDQINLHREAARCRNALSKLLHGLMVEKEEIGDD